MYAFNYLVLFGLDFFGVKKEIHWKFFYIWVEIINQADLLAKWVNRNVHQKHIKLPFK